MLVSGMCFLQPRSDPCFLMSLVLHVFAEPLFCRVVVKMCNLPQAITLCRNLPSPPTLLIVLVALTHLREMWHHDNSVSREYLHNLSIYSLHSMIAVSAEAWHDILYLVTPWQYSPRLGMLFHILSRLQGLTVSAEAWHAFPYLITPQYPPRLGMLFYVLSRLGSIRRAILHLITPWLYPPRLYLITPSQYPQHNPLRLGIIPFYIFSRLGSISRGYAPTAHLSSLWPYQTVVSSSDGIQHHHRFQAW